MLTQSQVQELFAYKDGELTRRSGSYADKVAGSLNKKGYVIVCVNYKLLKAHRLVFLYHHGYLPEQIDHIDGNKSNNRIENLRAATNGQNMMNRGAFRNNTSGCKGVFWDKEHGRWRVSIRKDKVLKHIGRFDDIELAELVAVEARDKYHGAFARHY